jgi:uncharacterized protein YbgA (DUF1722 family)/uncharacterized protein YbbK (DUF523 family)
LKPSATATTSRAATGAPTSAGLWRSESEIRVGVSSCLLGEKVRFNGDHKKNVFVAEMLSAYVSWVPVCPEVEAGMGLPREPVRLIGEPDEVRMVGTRTGRDYTSLMSRFSHSRVRALEENDLCGYILKKDSPSCGMERVKIYPGAGPPLRRGTGLFAQELQRRFPLLPVEEEGRLNDPVLRENFIERVFAYRRWKDFLNERYSRGRLVSFHTAHKFLLLSHSPKHYGRLGRIVAGSKALGARETKAAYGRSFMEAMAHRATTRKHTNVLLHLSGFFKTSLDRESRREMTELIADYRQGLVPLIVPVTLIRHHARRLGQDYLLGQTYLDPHPKELMLRNHV